MRSARPSPGGPFAELTAAGDGLADNEDVLRSVLAGCGDCIKILDLDGRLQFMSEGGKRAWKSTTFGPLEGSPVAGFLDGCGNPDAARGGTGEGLAGPPLQGAG